MNEKGALFDSGFDDSRPFSVTPDPAGVSLESALREFGPAAIDDLIPRLRAIASALDAAHARGVIHGALHPDKIYIVDDKTQLVAGEASSPPYVAPEVAAGGEATSASDQFAFAAIAFEWMFGRPISGPAERTVEVRAMPGVDRAALSRALTRALAPEPARRFTSCAQFVDAVAAAVVTSLPLAAADDHDHDPVEPFLPETPPPVIPDLPITAEESMATAAQPDFDTITPAVAAEPSAVESWRPAAAAMPRREAARFSGFALILAALVGALFGFAAGYMARPRALQTASFAQQGAESPGAQGAQPAQRAQGAEDAQRAQGAQSANRPAARSAPAPPAVATPPEPATRVGRILVRSTPSGASVNVDGVERGVTPLALRDLELGAREIVVARRGYAPESRRVVLTAERPSRSVEVRLTAAAAPRPATPATLGKPAAATGTLAVESRPAGAAVSIDGKPRGTTPLTITDLPPGDYHVTMTLRGYRDFATTVRVVAGERVRAAASLTAQEQE